MRSILAVLPELSLSTAIAFAQAVPTAHADIINAEGKKIGTAKFEMSNLDLSVKVTINVDHLPSGEHGVHIHNVGKCEGPAFTTAGGHFNPTNSHHGINNPQNPHPHLGDMANLRAGFLGAHESTFRLPNVTLADGPNSLFHEGGTSIVIHAKPDDMMSDPSGNSGDRIACGVIEKGEK